MALPAFRFAGTISGGGSPRITEWTVASGATFLRGDPVTASGVDDQIAGMVTSTVPILGIAMDKASGNIGKKIGVLECAADTIFSAALEGSWSADLVGDAAGVKLATGVYTVDPTEAADFVFTIRGQDTTDAGRVLVSVLPIASQAAGGTLQAE